MDSPWGIPWPPLFCFQWCHALTAVRKWYWECCSVESLSWTFLKETHYSTTIQRCLLLRRKAKTNLINVLKSRDIPLPTKVPLVKVMVFPVVTYRCQNWTIKKAELQRIDIFDLLFWRRLLRVLWTARSNQSILKEINPEYSLEGLILKLRLQYFGYLVQEPTHCKRPWC